MKLSVPALTLSLIASISPAVAQQAVPPDQVPENVRRAQEEATRKRIEAANAANPPKPVERPLPTVKSTDPDVQAMVKLLVGTYQSEPSGETPALVLSSSVITVDGLDNAVYFEVARADSSWAPFRQGVWQVWKRAGNLTVRQYEFSAVPATFKNTVVGMWTAPDMFPIVKAPMLAPIGDVSLTNAGGSFSGSGNGPTLIGGAFEFSTSWIINADSLSFTDRGIDAAGKQVWGPAQGTAGPTFKRAASTVKSERRAGGVVVIDFVPPSATERKIEDWADAAGEVVGYTDTGAEFYNSTTPNQRTGTIEPYRWQAAPTGGIPGWNTGMAGATAGTVRRIYVPTSVGFGARGSRGVPPNADLIFATQVQWVGEPKPPAPAPTPSAAAPTAAPSGGLSATGTASPAKVPAEVQANQPQPQVPAKTGN